jgi:hypothetical protein
LQSKSKETQAEMPRFYRFYSSGSGFFNGAFERKMKKIHLRLGRRQTSRRITRRPSTVKPLAGGTRTPVGPTLPSGAFVLTKSEILGMYSPYRNLPRAWVHPGEERLSLFDIWLNHNRRARMKTKGRNFFTPIARNALKSLDSEK